MEASLQTLRSYVTPVDSDIQINSLIQGSSRTIKIIAPSLVALIAVVVYPEKILFLISAMHLLAVFIFFKLNLNLKKLHMDLVQVPIGRKFRIADLLEMFKDFDTIVMKPFVKCSRYRRCDRLYFLWNLGQSVRKEDVDLRYFLLY
jgi:hypothetical protein